MHTIRMLFITGALAATTLVGGVAHANPGSGVSGAADRGTAAQAQAQVNRSTDRAVSGRQQTAVTPHNNGEWCGRQCDAKDPYNYVYQGAGGPSHWVTCASDAITVRRADGLGMSVSLRYSPFCETTWAEGNFSVDLRNESYYSNGTWRTVTLAYAQQGNGLNYTAMLDDHSLLNRACVDRGTVSSRICTSKY